MCANGETRANGQIERTDMRVFKASFGFGLFLLAATAFSQNARLSGHIVDTSGAVMPGAQIKIYQNDKLAQEAAATQSGDFEIPLEPGEYKVEISAPDFSLFTEMVRVTPGMGPLAVTMTLAQL